MNCSQVLFQMIRKMIWGSNFLHPDVKRITNYGRKLYVVILKKNFSCDVTQSHTHIQEEGGGIERAGSSVEEINPIRIWRHAYLSWSTENLLARNKKVLLKVLKAFQPPICRFCGFALSKETQNLSNIQGQKNILISVEWWDFHIFLVKTTCFAYVCKLCPRATEESSLHFHEFFYQDLTDKSEGKIELWTTKKNELHNESCGERKKYFSCHLDMNVLQVKVRSECKLCIDGIDPFCD